MRKVLLMLCLVPALCFGQDNAVVVKDFGCNGFVPADSPDGLPWLGWISTPDETQAVMTPSGNQKLTCHFDHDIELKKATSARNFGCGTYFGYTEVSKMTATPGGKATLTCWVKANQ